MFWQGALGIGGTFLFIVLFNNVIPWLIERHYDEEKSTRFTFLVFILEAMYTLVLIVVSGEQVMEINPAITMSMFTFLAFFGITMLYVLIADPSKISLKHKLFCSTLVLIVLFALNNNMSEEYEYKQNIVSINTPEVIETRYEILAGSDTTRISGSVSGAFTFVRGTTSEESYYKVFYDTKNEQGERIAKPITLYEDETEIVLIEKEEGSKEYLVEVVKTYYKEDRNKEPIERTAEYSETTYKLYLYESTFNGMVIDGNK